MNKEEEFYSYVRGSDTLYLWMKEIEDDFHKGKKVNKTKYNKIKRMEEKRREKALELLEELNRGRPVKLCMPPRTPPPPPPGGSGFRTIKF
jgi:hypothetical protein